MSESSITEPGAASGDAIKRLRAMQRLATGLLLLAAALYVLARSLEAQYPLASYLRAFCEAAMVGGLADWFAVTALFRHPLGIALPHTAIIATNKDRIGASLGRFVEQNFLASEVVVDKLKPVEFTAVAARWLADPRRSRPLAMKLASLLPRVLEMVGEAPLRRLLEHNVEQALKQIDGPRLIADLIDALVTRDAHHAVLDELLAQSRQLLAAMDPDIRARVRSKSAWLWQRLGMDDKLSDRLIAAIDDLLQEIAADPQHAWRERVTEKLHAFSAELRASPRPHGALEQGLRSLLDQAPIREYVGTLWAQFRAQLDVDAHDPNSRLAAQLQTAMNGLGTSLLADPPTRAALDARLRRWLLRAVEKRRHVAATLIAETVRRWDARTVTERIELAIGHDLQYIRINGTLIGGVAGVVIHGVSRFLP